MVASRKSKYYISIFIISVLIGLDLLAVKTRILYFLYQAPQRILNFETVRCRGNQRKALISKLEKILAVNI